MSERRALALEVVVDLVALVTYLATCARTVVGGDNGEFATLFARGGVAHPTGYPLYVLWLRAMHWIPASSPAHGAAIATCILGVACVAVLERACRAWGVRPSIAAFVAALYAVSPLAWSLATAAETFTLNALLAAAILFASAPKYVTHGARTTATLGLLAGLGLSNHHTIVLVFPIGIVAAVQGVRASPSRARAVVLGVGAFVVGLLPYVQLFVGARNVAWSWGETSTLAGFVHHVRRADYGTFRLQGTGRHAPLAHLAALLEHVTSDLFALPVLALFALVAWKRVSREGRPPHLQTLALLATFLTTGPLFVLLFNADLRDVGALIVERFYLLPELVVCVITAIAFEACFRAFPRAVAALYATPLVVGAVGSLSFVRVREGHRPSVELYLRNTLSFVPPRAVLLGRGDARFGGFLYAREALALRTDVAFVDPSLLVASWYRRYASSIVDARLDSPPEGRDVDEWLIGALLADGHDVFVTGTPNASVQKKFAAYPIGTLMRVVPRDAPLPDPLALLAANDDVFAHFTLEKPPYSSSNTWAGNLQLAYARPWSLLASAFARMGDEERARACAARAEQLAPAPSEADD